MKSKHYLNTSTCLLIILFGSALCFTPLAEAQKVHALLVIMDDDLDLRHIVDANRLNVKKMFQLLDVNPEIWLADERLISPADIVKWIEARQVGVEDTIFVYYSGHGHIDNYDRQYLNINVQKASYSLLRSDLTAELSKKKCRLRMLVTDTCSNRVETSPPIAKSAAAVLSKERRYTKDLFLKHKGFLDITAASPGQYAWGNNHIGGYFTAALIQSFTASSDTNNDGFLSWKEVFTATRSDTQSIFSQTSFLPSEKRKMDNIGQTTQTPLAYTFPQVLTSSPPAELTIYSNPSGASVYIDDTIIGKTPLEKYEFDIGTSGERKVKMRVELEGYKTNYPYIKNGYNKETGKLTLKSRWTYTWKKLHLEKLILPSTLSIASKPSGATVYIDDVKIGKTPLENYVIDVGESGKKRVMFKLMLKGYKSKEWGQAILISGESYSMDNISLEKIPINWGEIVNWKNISNWAFIGVFSIVIGLLGTSWLLLFPWYRPSESEKWNDSDSRDIMTYFFYFSWIVISIACIIEILTDDNVGRLLYFGLCIFPIFLISLITAYYMLFLDTQDLGIARFVVIILSLVSAIFVPFHFEKIKFFSSLELGLFLGGIAGLTIHFIVWIVDEYREEELSYKIRKGLSAAIVVCGYIAGFIIVY